MLRRKIKKGSFQMIRYFAPLLAVALLLPLTAGAEEKDQVSFHDGYWVAKVKSSGLGPRVTVINDMHVDADTMRITVYAQSRVLGRVLSPPQVDPGECAKAINGDRHCFPPDAVYLNGSGRELDEDDGNGAWWVKHSWVLGGEGYCNTELEPKEEYAPCMAVKGILLEDGLTMKIGGKSEGRGEGFNLRAPALLNGEVRYFVTRYGSLGNDSASPAEQQWEIEFECQSKASAFDGLTRACPSMTD
jgi:hypothetical protein